MSRHRNSHFFGDGVGPSSSFGSAFSADDTFVTIVPRFDMDKSVPLFSFADPSSSSKVDLSSRSSSSPSSCWGPCRAGIECQVPLWLALLLHERSLCKLSMPPWMDPDNLVQVLGEEKRLSGLVDDAQRLPFYYYEIGKRLARICQKSAGWNLPHVPLLIEDIFQVRTDKLRQQFLDMMGDHSQSFSRVGARRGDGTDDAAVAASIPDLLVKVNGIASQELALLGPFVSGALTDVRSLLQGGTRDKTGGGERGDPEVEGKMRRSGPPRRRHGSGSLGDIDVGGDGVPGKGGDVTDGATFRAAGGENEAPAASRTAGDDSTALDPPVRRRLPLRRFR